MICQVDSVANVQRLAGLLGSPRRRLPVLIEVGFQGGRTGIRNVDEAASVLHAIAAAPALQVVGATAFEGIVGGKTAEARRDGVREVMAKVRAVAEMVAADAADAEKSGLDEVILSAGGSTHFVEVADQLARPLAASLPARVVLRSGCTVTHDHGGYELTSPWGTHATGNSPRLQAALEVWAPVISRPERSLALAAAGRRDLPYDLGLPTPLKVRGLDGSLRLASGLAVTGLNDQHAYLSLDAAARLEVGESIGFGIAHPCSAFDRWRFIPVVNQSYDVLDVYETIF